MTYDESSQLMMDSAFGGRIKVAVLKYAAYIQDEATSVPAHSSRLRWAQGAFQNPTMTATQIQPPTVMTPQVQSAGAEVTDANLQTAVESVVSKFL